MATAHGIVTINSKPYPYSITARITTEGTGSLYLKGKVSETFPQTFGPVIQSIRSMEDYLDIDLDCADVNLRLDIPHNYPLSGASYGLTTGIAILAAATGNIIPSENCYTGCLNADGSVERVADIHIKRRGAAGHGFKKLFLPREQIDLFSTLIAQCPCGSLADAYGITFWSEK